MAFSKSLPRLDFVKVSLDCGELRRWWLRSVFYLDHANLEDVTRLGANEPQGT